LLFCSATSDSAREEYLFLVHGITELLKMTWIHNSSIIISPELAAIYTAWLSGVSCFVDNKT